MNMPKYALSVRQPWAWLIFHGKDVENRSWRLRLLPQRIIIHAGKAKDGYEHFYCDRHCMGRWNAEHYGFIAHPENIPTGRRKRQFDWDMVWQKHLETGYGAWRLARLLGMKIPAVSYILSAKRKERVNALDSKACRL